MSTLALAVVLLLALTGALFLGGLAYLAHQHPKLATPLMVALTGGAALAGALAVVVAVR
ncbi:hypothetical protein ABZW02_33010 [Streptomyces sp. NPDC005180]|uniref:hypothetical protein n=1 Tax=Streptomyces sp. NPDC005180 TaxID=3156868 RepID=UPI0033A988AF